MAPPNLKSAPTSRKQLKSAKTSQSAKQARPAAEPAKFPSASPSWKGITRVSRILIGLNFLGMILLDIWGASVRGVLFLDPMRPTLHQFLTSAFFNFGFAPFILGATVIVLAGVAVERVLGGVKTFAIYLGSGILGGIGYIALSNLQWVSPPLPAGGIAASGLLGACVYLRIRLWGNETLALMGRWEGDWKSLAGVHSLFTGGVLLCWITGRFEVASGTAALAHLIGWMGGMLVTASTDLLDHKFLPSPPGTTTRDRAVPPAPFPPEAAVHPFSGKAQTDSKFIHETTETVPRKSPAAAAAAPTEVHVRTPSPGPVPAPPSVDPAVKNIIHAIDACNPGNAWRSYQAWTASDANKVLDAPNQWRLAQLLISSHENEASISVLKRLISQHPQCYWIAQARSELGAIYTRMPGRRHDAVEQLSAALRVKESGSDDGPHPLAPQVAERIRATLRELGYAGPTEISPEKSVASPESVRDKVPETSIMAKKPLPPTGQSPKAAEPNQAPINTYSNVFGDPEATGNFAPLTLDEEGPAKVPKMYGAETGTKSPAAKSPGPPPLPGAVSSPPPPPPTRSASPPPPPPPVPGSAPIPSRSSEPIAPPSRPVTGDDPFAASDQSGVFKQSLWEEDSKKKKQDIKFTAPENPNVNLNDDAPIVFDESTTGSRGTPIAPSAADVFGSPGGTTGLVPPDWSNVAGTGSLPSSGPMPSDLPPMPDQGVNSAPFWNKSSPFMFPEEDKGAPKKRATGEDRFATPPPSAPHAPASGEKARPLKKKEVKPKDDVDFFPTPVPFSAKGQVEDVFTTPPHPIPSPTAKAEDRFKTPPPKPPAPAHEPRIAQPHSAPASPPPPPVSAPTSHSGAPSPSGTDVWSAFLKEDRGWSDQPTPPPKAPVPPRAAPAPAVEERMIADSAPTVQRPAAHPVQEPPPSKPSAPKSDAAIGFAGSSPDQTMVWSRQYANERNLTFNSDSKYNIIIAPASTLMVRELIGMLRAQLGMNEEAALYALKHRHGILLSDMALDEAVAMCHNFTEQGQDVALVEQDDRLEFGEPVDVMRIKMEEKTARYFTMDAAYVLKWKGLIGISCGRVMIHPGAPGRDMIDLYFAEPGMNLRIWRNTLMSAPPAFTGKADNEMEFHALAKELVKRAPHAIQTQSFIEWTQAKTPTMPVEFSNMVEYQNYTRWYLMAHYGRSKLFNAGKKS